MGKWSRRAFITTGVLTGGAVVFGVAIRPGDRRSEVSKLVAGEDESVLHIWLKISPDNTITAIVPHAEMGQGTHTTMAMMLADELDADWSQVRMMEAPAHAEYANYALAKGFMLGDPEFPAFLIDTVDGFFLSATKWMGLQFTGGSSAVQYTGMLGMRVAGAGARSMLLQAASEKWNVPVESLTAKSGSVSNRNGEHSATFAELAADAAKLPAPVKPRLKTESEYTIMGTSVPRLDIPAKVDGSAGFGIDVVLASMKYATVRQSPVFGTMVASVNEASVQDMPGIRKVVTLENAVAVIADGYWQAKQAIDKLEVTYEEGDDSSREQSDIYRQFGEDMDNAIANGDEQIDFTIGNIDNASADAAPTIEAEYRVPYLAHSPMEPMNCTAWVHDGVCEIWTGTQNPLGCAHEVAEALQMEPKNVTVHNQYLGGGFGRRLVSDCAIQAARIAAEVHYPVKLLWSREEDTRHDFYRQATISRFSATLDSSGHPTVWTNQFVEKHEPAEAPHIPYAIPNQKIHYTNSKTHVPWGFWRSVDHSVHGFFTESFVDELAHAAGKDPYRFRRNQLAASPRFRDVLDLAAEKAGWERPLPANYGRGISLQKSFGTIVAQVVEVEIEAGKPRVRRVICAIDPGFAMHPDGVKAQMESGIIFGLTAALYGEISIHRGSVAQSNFHDYKMMRMDESPEIETYIINGGGKVGGAGEPGTPAIAAALTNAIFDATGVRIRELPISNHNLNIDALESQDIA
jgi:isoquinoline 1-oxidoreductase beta subunit